MTWRGICFVGTMSGHVAATVDWQDVYTPVMTPLKILSVKLNSGSDDYFLFYFTFQFLWPVLHTILFSIRTFYWELHNFLGFYTRVEIKQEIAHIMLPYLEKVNMAYCLLVMLPSDNNCDFLFIVYTCIPFCQIIMVISFICKLFKLYPVYFILTG